ncbi:hypothetical protein MNEG_5283 [Monoraphidium neglectum]|uniref:Uncharacterized protein n=1 Tax=Monoraphidium neglectum TaxID=145388 RepID=A0A0D2MQI0_9CHLO|nr:hypothetical protein MNEG_5283 [Monoraphidium neglectum]KIZ02677.1 hypothetical protein MNEG_5283 [Monoraphidium neglectum]|eukprot:XP_013901696.1 hypothetical protein MNEG_5283 [Monoraphidium neglectum]
MPARPCARAPCRRLLDAVATKEFVYAGKDGFEALSSAPVLVDAEQCIALNTAARDYFYVLEVINKLKYSTGAAGAGAEEGAASEDEGAEADDSITLRRLGSFARHWKHRATAGAHISAPGGQAESSKSGARRDAQRVGTCVRDALGRYVIAPAVEGRIVCLQPLPE